METKVCCKCMGDFPIENFYKDKRKKSGYTSRCKPCFSVVDVCVTLEKKGCSKCKEELDISCFSKDKGKKSGRASQCKTCMANPAEYIVPERKVCRGCDKELEISCFFKDKTKKTGHSSRCKACSSSNKESLKKAREKYLKSEKGVQRRAEYREKTKDTKREKTREWIKKKRKTDPAFRIKMCLRSRVNRSIQRGTKTAPTLELLGCTILELKEHISKQLPEGIFWEDHGKKFEIDHIVPVSAFDLLDPVQQRVCFHYTNLQPLSRKENLKKGAKFSDKELDALKERLSPEVSEKLERKKLVLTKEFLDFEKNYLKSFGKLWVWNKIPPSFFLKKKKRGENIGNVVSPGEKRCARCLEVKPVSEYHKRSTGKILYQSYCKTCIAAIKRQRAEASRS
ncbi:putative prophage protein [Insectomime virus]|uniref:Putative prophage protein n=1 Tax=Tunisvirus fontaine2 TaxID=1421067 RepID=V9SGI5_9VIRU|nr:endonuclease VII [Tunisvirus fontaine2]AHA46059.1 putative prophage protein [Insectomime virus]AHC54877.1 putative prophage protein [Tunisvirus fontaine2]